MKSNNFVTKFVGRKTSAVLLITVGVAAFCFALRASEVKFQLPPETATLKPGPNFGLAQQCTMCHSTDYISTQPRLTRTQWTGEVNKMISKYGAPIQTNMVDQIVDYLTATYGKENPTTTASK